MNCSWSRPSSALGSWYWGRAEFTGSSTAEKTISIGCVATSWYCVIWQQRPGSLADLRVSTSISCLGVPSTISESNVTSYALLPLNAKMAIVYDKASIIASLEVSLNWPAFY